MFYGLFKRCPVVRNVDDLWPEVLYDLGFIKSRFVRRILDFISKMTYKLPSALTPISLSYASYIMEKYKVKSKKIHVIEVGVDLDIFNPGVDATSCKYSFDLMYSGILGFGYDFNIILDVAKKILIHEDIHFIIRGFGELAPFIREKVKVAKIKNVTVSTEFLSQKELVLEFRSTDVFLLPLNRAADKGLPTKIFEYQACGKPIICCSQGESAKYIRSTNSGLVVNPGDSQALSNAIIMLYKNRNLMKKLGVNGYKHVSKHLTCKKVGERMHKVFQELGEKR